MARQENNEPLDIALLAETLGLEVVSNERFYAELHGKPAGARVELSVRQTHVAVQDFLPYCRVTFEISVAYKYGGGPRFKLLREGTFRSWLKGAGYQDIEVGDSSLDLALTIKGEPEQEIRKLILANRALLAKYAHGWRRDLPKTDGKTIRYTLHETTTYAEEAVKALRHCLDLLLGMATFDLVGMESLLSLPGAEEDRGLEDKVVVRVRAPTLIEFYPEWDTQSARLRARAPVQGLPALAPLSCRERQTIESHFGVRGPPLKHLAASELSVDEDGVWLGWPGKVEDVEVLETAIRLLVLLSSPHGSGAYR